MLKSCWDCIAGYNANRNQAENEVAYGTRVNGDTQRAPPWPNPRLDNEIMFLLPRPLNSGDRIDVAGRMSADPQTFSVNLITGYNSPDYNNIACQLEAKFPASNENKVTLKIVQNGYHEEISGGYQGVPATDWFADSSFNFGFTISVNRNYDAGPMLDIFIGESFLEQIKLKHNMEDIRFLTLHGDIAKVDKLDFQFA